MNKVLVLFCTFCWGVWTTFGLDFPQQPAGPVTDLAGLFSSVELNKLSEEVRLFGRQSENPCQLMVVTLPSLCGEAIETVAGEIFAKWKPGEKGKDNGLLYVISYGDRKFRLQTGYGMEGVLPDGRCGEIVRKAVTPFRESHWYEGVHQVLLTLRTVLVPNLSSQKVRKALDEFCEKGGLCDPAGYFASGELDRVRAFMEAYQKETGIMPAFLVQPPFMNWTGEQWKGACLPALEKKFKKVLFACYVPLDEGARDRAAWGATEGVKVPESWQHYVRYLCDNHRRSEDVADLGELVWLAWNEQTGSVPKEWKEFDTQLGGGTKFVLWAIFGGLLVLFWGFGANGSGRCRRRSSGGGGWSGGSSGGGWSGGGGRSGGGGASGSW